MLKTYAKSNLGRVIAIAIVASAVVLGVWRYERASVNLLSQEVSLSANVVHIASSVPGRIDVLKVAENDKVEKGDLLFSVDPEPYRLAVAQAEGDLAVARALYETQKRNIRAERANAAVANHQVARAQTNLQLAEQTLRRLTALQPKGYVTAQQVDDAETAKRDAEVSLQEALEQTVAADALVSSIDAAKAMVETREAALALARRELANTKIYAPHDGRVVGLTISTGEFVITGESIFTLINTENWYATAFFSEVELAPIKAGSCASVYVMADRSVEIKGEVIGISWGVAPESLINLPRGLPYVPKNLNWVRVAQRFPVRIKLEDPPENLMRVGASAVAVIHDEKHC